jgi:hypothetical protein
MVFKKDKCIKFFDDALGKNQTNLEKLEHA